MTNPTKYHVIRRWLRQYLLSAFCSQRSEWQAQNPEAEDVHSRKPMPTARESTPLHAVPTRRCVFVGRLQAYLRGVMPKRSWNGYGRMGTGLPSSWLPTCSEPIPKCVAN